MARLRNSWIGHQAMPEFHNAPKVQTPTPQVLPNVGGTGGTAMNPVLSGDARPPVTPPVAPPAGPTYPPIPIGPPAFPPPVTPETTTAPRTKLVNSVMKAGGTGGRGGATV